MKLEPEDPRLTAYLLGELPAEEAAAVERAVAADPALQAAMQELEVIRQLLSETLKPGSATLLPAQRDKIHAAANASQNTRSLISLKSWKLWLPPLAIAAAITLIAVFSSHKSADQKAATLTPGTTEHISSTAPQSPNIKPMPAPGPKDPGRPLAHSKANPVATSDLPPLRSRNYLAAADFPTLELPVQSGKSSLDWIRQAIITRRELPDHNAVRLEEILNSFSLRPAGLTGIARLPANSWHPDNRSTAATSHAATISTETLACPWKPSATLVLISIRGNPYSDCEIKAVFRANTANVLRYRLLGFSPVEGRDSAPLPSLLPAKSATMLVIEVEPSTVGSDLGVIEWSVNQQSSTSIPVDRQGDAEPSDDARFAALVCTYAQWLTGDPAVMIDTELLAALARETASEALSGERAEFLNLIDLSLNL